MDAKFVQCRLGHRRRLVESRCARPRPSPLWPGGDVPCAKDGRGPAAETDGPGVGTVARAARVKIAPAVRTDAADRQAPLVFAVAALSATTVGRVATGAADSTPAVWVARSLQLAGLGEDGWAADRLQPALAVRQRCGVAAGWGTGPGPARPGAGLCPLVTDRCSAHGTRCVTVRLESPRRPFP